MNFLSYCRFFFAVTLLLLGVAEATENDMFYAVNLSSAIPKMPVKASLKNYPYLEKIPFLTDGEKVYPVCVIGNDVFISMTPPPMTFTPLKPVSKPRKENLFSKNVTTSPANVQIDFPEFRISALRNSFYVNQKKLFSSGSNYTPWQVLNNTAVAVKLRKGNLTVTVFSTGSLKIYAENRTSLHLESQPQISTVYELSVLRPPRKEELIKPNFESILLDNGLIIIPEEKTAILKNKTNLIIPAHGSVKTALCEDRRSAVTASKLYPSMLARQKSVHEDKNAKEKMIIQQKYHNKENRENQDITIKISRPDFKNAMWEFYDQTNALYAKWIFSVDKSSKRYTLDVFSKFQEQDKKDESKQQSLKKTITFTDLSGRNIFLSGNLFYGGYPLQSIAGSYGIIDLDGDNDPDVYVSGIRLTGTEKNIIESSGYKFDMLDVNAGFYLLKSGKPGNLAFAEKTPYLDGTAPVTWYFGKTMLHSKHKDAQRTFEEQILYSIRSHDNTMINGPAILYVKTTDDNIDRLGMGSFGGTDEHHLNWNIQIDPVQTNRTQPESFRICEYQDPTGNTMKFTSSILPDSWDGGALPLKVQTNGNLDWSPFNAWHKTTSGNYFDVKGFRAVFVPKGTFHRATECMYSGMAQTGHRIEYAPPKARPLTIYHSELYGALHLKHAFHGHQGFAAGHVLFRQDAIRTTLHRLDAVSMPDRFIASRDLNNIQGARIEGPMYLAYFDKNRDGFQDTYLYDAENDGLFEKSLYFDKSNRMISFRQGSRISAWRKDFVISEARYVPENYNYIEHLYLKSLTELPYIVRGQITDSGLPVIKKNKRNRSSLSAGAKTVPDFFITLSDSWNTFIGLDLYHTTEKTFGWTDMSEQGFSTLSMRATAAGFVIDSLTNQFTTKNLNRLDLLVVPSPIIPVSSKETAALLKWIDQGGTLFIVPIEGSKPDRKRMENLLSLFNVSLSDKRLDVKASIAKYWVTYNQFFSKTAGIQIYGNPAPAQDIKYFYASDPTLTNGMSFLTAEGYPLKYKKTFTPILSYKNDPVIISGAFGSGRVYVSGINLFANKNTGHPQHSQPGAANDEFLERLIKTSVPKEKFPAIRSIIETTSGYKTVITGKGGNVIFPATGEAQVFVNGKPVKIQTTPTPHLKQTMIPPGETLFEIRRVP